MEIINKRIDGLLTELEGIFKEAVEKNRGAQDELDGKVKELIAAHDAKEEVKRYVEIKDLSDYIALTLSMPIEDKTKEEVIEEIVRVIKNGRETKESV